MAPQRISDKGQRILIGIASRLTNNAVRQYERSGMTPRRLRMLDRAILSRRLSQLPPPSPELRARIDAMAKQTKYWHGTGRYQYRDGQVIDVLKYIVQHRELRPSRDPFDILGHTNSVSLAYARIYARAYADLHRNATVRAERHGSSAFWSVFFLADYALEAAHEEGGLSRVIQRLSESGKDEWHGKINRQQLSVFASFATGSDIDGNYPILFGVRDVDALPTSHAIAIHEVR